MERHEEWKSVDGFRGGYEVSNLGRVRSLKTGVPKIMRHHDNREGYRKVQLLLCGVVKDLYVHRLVAMAFVDRPSSDRQQVNHINADRSDNRAENLEWVTPAENQRHASTNWRRRRMDAESVKAIAIDVFRLGLGTFETAQKFGVSTRTIRMIKSGKAYSALTNGIRKDGAHG